MAQEVRYTKRRFKYFFIIHPLLAIHYKDKFDKVGEYDAFEWVRPEHMEPKGELNLNQIRRSISQQYHQCLNYLELMGNGEGLLCKTTMTVNELGKINVHEYIYFLSLHARRHLAQMKNNELEIK